MQYESGAFDGEKYSNVFFYLPSTVDRNEKINKYITSLNLKPFSVNPNDIYQDFNPADPNSNRSAVVEYIRKVVLQS